VIREKEQGRHPVPITSRNWRLLVFPFVERSGSRQQVPSGSTEFNSGWNSRDGVLSRRDPRAQRHLSCKCQCSHTNTRKSSMNYTHKELALCVSCREQTEKESRQRWFAFLKKIKDNRNTHAHTKAPCSTRVCSHHPSTHCFDLLRAARAPHIPTTISAFIVISAE